MLYYLNCGICGIYCFVKNYTYKLLYVYRIIFNNSYCNTSPNYISVQEYLKKYGINNVIKGLNKAEVENNVKVLKTGTAEEL